MNKKGQKTRRVPVIGGTRLHNRQLAITALTHPSYRNENPREGIPEDFNRLEFFGDAVLNLVICEKLFLQYPKANEGLLSRMRSILVSRRIISRVAKDLGIHHFLRLGRSLERKPIALKTKILTDALEAYIGALYLDRGFKSTAKFILRNFRPFFDPNRLFRLDPNPKSTLQELCQREWQMIPTYINSQTAEGFYTEVALSGRLRAVASGRTRQEAEERAARLLIRKVRQELWRRSKKYSSGRKLRKGR